MGAAWLDPCCIEYPGAVYHVMARGNHGQRIFQNNRDRHCFLETLGEACEKTGWRIHAYVLMANHYHLLVRTGEANLSHAIRWLDGRLDLRELRDAAAALVKEFIEEMGTASSQGCPLESR